MACHRQDKINHDGVELGNLLELDLFIDGFEKETDRLQGTFETDICRSLTARVDRVSGID
jgi:hypothetical protein